MFFLLLFSAALWAMCCSLPRQYHFINEAKSWSEAQSFCRKTYTDLATVDDMEDMNRLLESANGSYNGSAWIGLYDDPQKSWRWSLDDPKYYKDGERDFRKWWTVTSLPQRRDNCVASCLGAWIPFSCCTTMNSFLCFNGKRNARKTFELVNMPATWFQAQCYCKKKYTSLAIIHNSTENYMLNYKYQEDMFWIGLYRMRKWSDHSKKMFRNWLEEEEAEYLESQTLICTTVLFGESGKWKERNCDITLPFICYTVSAASVRQYHFVNESKSWFEAQSFCRNTYTDLATVDNMRDMNRLLESANGSYNGSAWIGLYDGPQNDWRWFPDDPKCDKDGERDFRSWVSFPVSIFTYDECATLNRAGFMDRTCSSPYQFICFDGREDAKKRHVLVSDYQNWTDAQAYCRKHYTDLASVRNEQEYKELFSMIGDKKNIWIGLRKVITWSDQSNSSFSYFLSQKGSIILEPHCTAVSFSNNGKWLVEKCFSKLPFICYSLNTTAQPLTTLALPPQPKD